MENKKVIKFRDFNTNEQTYKVSHDGKIEKQEWELYKDWHPAKFKVSNLTKKIDTTPFESGEYVWIIKKSDIIVSILSSDLEQNAIEDFFNTLKSTSGESNNISDNEAEDSIL